ncbi:hypothetical protein A0H81_08917 [Grifola frondosa]|uniref:Uncharacterized protein n=1 Tax=Grifola frondosa TaxID=5627 RepID=A0A1C7M3S2_GRIFR|nr:hypothetical protein A0H81_08917 [Grifola frondosa]
MTNWQDPNTIIQNSLSLIKLSHVMGGIFIWEWVTTLNFELGLLSHQVEWSIAMLAYMLCRFVTMGVVVCEFVIFSVTQEVNCSAIMRMTLVFADLSFAFAPCIIVLRVIAIWNRNKIVILYVSVVYLLNFSLLIRGVIKGMDSVWDPASNSCVSTDTTNTRINGTASFLSDIVLLVVMLIGMWRVKSPGSIWKRLYHQGVIWVVIATISYVPMVTFLWLDLNSAMNQMFLTPTCVTM